MADDRARIIWHHVASLRSNDRNLYTYMEYKTFFKFDQHTFAGSDLQTIRSFRHLQKKGQSTQCFFTSHWIYSLKGYSHTHTGCSGKIVFSPNSLQPIPLPVGNQLNLARDISVTPIGWTFSVQPIAGTGKVAIFRKFLKKKSEQCVSWQTTVYYYYIYLTCMQQFRSRSVHRDLLHSQPLLQII